MSSDESDSDDEGVGTRSGQGYASNGAKPRRAVCRYGSGCTHIHDSSHRERFCHPQFPNLNNEQLKSQFICNECGYATSQLATLQSHLQRKTAWSNVSLVGCRINCLVDFKEWHEGYVLQYHKSGKHFIDFRQVNEKRWLVMKKIAFYILERPVPTSKNGHVLSDDLESEGLAPLENNWVFCEDITLDYAFAQSVLFKIYGNAIQETGHLTKGHTCLTDADRLNAQYVKGSLLYGELLPRGANKAFGAERLNTQNASVLFDLGMGTGKILIQAFLQFKNLRYIFGIELSSGRYKIAEEALLKMVQLLGEDSYHVQVNPGRFIIVTEVVRVSPTNPKDGSERHSGKSRRASDAHEAEEIKSQDECDDVNQLTVEEIEQAQDGHGSGDDGVEEEYIERVLHLQCGNMFDVKNISTADVVMMETDIPADQHARLQLLLGEMKPDSRVLTYLDLRRIWQNSNGMFRQVDVNKHQADRYPTSWSVQRGHHFYLWSKVSGVSEFNQASSWEWSSGISRGLHNLSHHASQSNSTNNNNTAQLTPNNASNAAGGSSESPITMNGLRFTAPPNTFIRGNSGNRYTSHDDNAPVTNVNDGTHNYILVEEDRCFPFRMFAYLRGNSKQGKKVKKRPMSVAEYESSLQRVTMPVIVESRPSVPQISPSSSAAVLAALNLEPLTVPSRSGRVSPDPSALPSRNTHSPELLQPTEPQASPERSPRGKSSKSKGRITTAGVESVKLKSPREPRESKKRHKSAERASRASTTSNPNGALPQTPVVDDARDKNYHEGRSSASVGHSPHVKSPPPTLDEQPSILRRDASRTHMQQSAALGAIDGVETAAIFSSQQQLSHNNSPDGLRTLTSHSRNASSSALVESGFVSEGRLRGSTPPMVASNKSRTSPGAHSSTSTPPGPDASVESAVWHDPTRLQTRGIDLNVAQDLVSTDTITGQASAGARVLVQQAQTYESHPKSRIIGRGGSKKKLQGGEVALTTGAGSKPRSYRINNTIPVRAATASSPINNVTSSLPPQRVENYPQTAQSPHSCTMS